MFDEHDGIIPRSNDSYHSNFTDTSKIDVVNVYAPSICEASENGKDCWHHAEIVYHTTPYKMNGVFYPSETRHLCKACYEKMWGFISAWHEARAALRLQDEGGQVA